MAQSQQTQAENLWADLTPDQLRAAYPGVRYAFEFVIPSYEWMITRFEAAENRVQAMLVFAATVSAAIPGAAKSANPNISFHDWRFLVAAFLFAALLIIGLYARMRGGLHLVNTRVLHDRWLQYDQWEFEKNALFYAAEHFRLNAIAIEGKARAATWMIGLFLGELCLLAGWIVASSVSQ